MSPEAHPRNADGLATELLAETLRRSHLTSPSDLPMVVAEQAAAAGATDTALYVVDLETEALMPLGGPERPPLSVTGTVAGRAFSQSAILRTPTEDGGERLWFPLVDGTERVGVAGISFSAPRDEATVELFERFAHLVATLVMTKRAYTDVVETARRRHEVSLASELILALVPPLAFATDRLTLGAILEPAYDIGGDALDYAVNGDVLHLGVFDAMGHGLPAAGVAAFALSAYRHSRRTGRDLIETYVSMDDAVGRRFPEHRFVTAVIAQLDLASGRLRWISAGHPPPLLIRGGRRAHTLESPPAPPLGIELPGGGPPTVATESLEPGDLLLLYTDGLTEARDPEGALFSIDGLAAFIEREATGGQPAPETLRRLRHAVIGSGRARLRDDATALLIEWRRGTEHQLVPELT